MKKKIKELIAAILYPFNKRLGYVKKSEVQGETFHKNSLLHNFFSIVQKSNFRPRHIVDVGANHGTWTRHTLNYFPDAFYTLLEPQAWMKNSIDDLLIKNKNISFHGVGAGEVNGSFKFTIVGRDDSCTFGISESEAERKGYRQIDVPVVTLNDFLPDKSELTPDIIKIDAEGLDLSVIRGASNFFGKTEVFMVEAGVVNKFFTNSFLDVVKVMDGYGYRLFDITDLNRPFDTKVLWLVELVFVKKNGILDSMVITD